MKIRIQLFLILSLILANLTACGPSQADLNATATQISVADHATQTALAPTATVTVTPSPTTTPTSTPTRTPSPTQTNTPIPTYQVDNFAEAFQYLVLLDIATTNIIEATDLLENRKLDHDQADARIQTFHHVVGIVKDSLQKEIVAFSAEIHAAVDETLQACGRWWRSESDAKTLNQEMTSLRASFQPRLEALRTGLLELGSVDMSFEQSLRETYTVFADYVDLGLEEVGSWDIFQMQRKSYPGYGMAPTLGVYQRNRGYTTPDESFNCRFAYSGKDGEFLYDFIFPDRTLIVLTNDFGLGQAVEQRPLTEPIGDAVANRKLVETLFKYTLLPQLKQQHYDLQVLQEKWIAIPGESPLSALQVILYLPRASHIGKWTPDGDAELDVYRSLWIFIGGERLYTISYQETVRDWRKLTASEYIIEVTEGVTDLQQSCTFK